jgi:iron complex outermembrane receptor protein
MHSFVSAATCRPAWLVVLVLAAFALPAVAAAQPAATSVEGTIHDQTGAVLPGATVTSIRRPAGDRHSVVTDAQGRYDLGALPPGEYEIEATLPGFTTGSATATVQAGATRTVDLVLEISPLATSVTVTRTEQARRAVPYAVTLIGQDEIQAGQRRESLAEAAGGVPGLFAQDRGNLSLAGGLQAAIRAPMIGFAMRGIQVLQDGIPLTTADGTTNTTNVDLGSAGRMEIIRGPSSVLYGNAAGGVISIHTQFPTASRFEIEPDFQFGSFGYQRQQVKAGGSSGQWSYLLNLNRMETDGYRRHTHGEIRRANLVVRDTLSPSTQIQGVFNFFDMPFGENASTVTEADARQNPRAVRQIAIDEGWGEGSKQGQGGLNLEHHFGEDQVIRATGWGQWRDVRNPIPGRIVELGRQAGGFRSEYAGQATLGAVPIAWTTGVDLSYQRDDRTESVNDRVPADGGEAKAGAQLVSQVEKVLSAAPFVQATLTLHPRWFVTAGLRYDHYDFSATDRFLSDGDQSGSRGLHAASPMAGVTFAASDALNVYANVSTAYQTPTTVELSNRPTGEGGFNEELEPATLRGVEVGARGRVAGGQMSYEIAAYRSRFANAFVEFQRADEQSFFRNAAESSRNGLEARLEWRPDTRLSAYLSYTRQDFDFVTFEADGADFSGRIEPGVPPQQVYLGGRYGGATGLNATAQLRWVDAFPVDNANTAFNWAYTVVDVRAGFSRRWGGLELRPFLGVDNLFDERYNGSTIPNSFGRRFFEPSPGRAIYAGLSLGASR